MMNGGSDVMVPLPNCPFRLTPQHLTPPPVVTTQFASAGRLAPGPSSPIRSTTKPTTLFIIPSLFEPSVSLSGTRGELSRQEKYLKATHSMAAALIDQSGKNLKDYRE
jgi:hypothetical protein